MRKLTKREKVLLYIMTLALLASGAWLLLNPLMSEADELDATLISVEMQVRSMRQSVAESAAQNVDYDALSARAAALNESFLPVLSNDDLDRYITGMLQDNGLLAESLLIAASDTQAENASLVNLRADVTASGTLDQFMALAQYVHDTGCLRISNAVISERKPVSYAVPLSQAELAEAQAEVAVQRDEVRKKKGAAAKIPDALPYRIEIKMEYAGKLTFEITEFDAAFLKLLAAYNG